MRHAIPASAALALAITLSVTVLPARSEPMPVFSVAPLPPEQAIFSHLPQNDPRLAMGLSLALNGAGQFYNRESTKGWWLLAPVLAFPAAWLLDSALGVGYVRFGDAVLIMGTKLYSAYDAYRVADEAARAAERR